MLRDLYPAITIDYLTTNQTKEILKHNPHINNLFTVDRYRSILGIMKDRKKIFGSKKYDIVIDLQNNIKSYFFSRNLAHEILRFDKRRLFKLQLVYLKKRSLEEKYIPELYIKTAEKLGAKPDGKGLEFWLEKDLENNSYQSELIVDNNSIRIVVAPGAYHFTKRWPIERFAELCTLLSNDEHIDILLVGGPQDIKAGKYIEKYCDVNNQIDKLTLIESAEAISRSNLVITNDTAVMHIAAARGVPVIALFGSTVRDFGFAPYKSESYIIEKDVSCRPCTHYGKSKCQKQHFDCMKLITVNEVYETVNLILKK